MTGYQNIFSNRLVVVETFLGWCPMGENSGRLNQEGVAMTVTSLLLENLKI